MFLTNELHLALTVAAVEKLKPFARESRSRATRPALLMSRWPSPKFLLIKPPVSIPLRPMGAEEWAQAQSRQPPPNLVVLEGRSNTSSACKLADTEPPKTTEFGEFWIASYALGKREGCPFSIAPGRCA